MENDKLIIFSKMHGLGNDYVVVDESKEEIIPEYKKPVFVEEVCRRGFSVGADGVIFVAPATVEEADIRFRIFNADGSEAEMCGNGIRCFVKFVYENGIVTEETMERKCSIILQKDIGMVVAFTGLGNGCKVVDAGTGAGATAMHFANVVGPEGTVVSYEVREDFAEIAERNVEGFGLKNLQVKCGDITEGISEDELDLVFLDLPKP